MEDTEFFCVICGQSLCASVDFAGSLGECPTCLSMVPIPGYIPEPGKSAGCVEVYPPGILSIELVYRCEGCRRQLQVDARWQGITHECPQCAARTRVPSWSGAVPEAPVIAPSRGAPQVARLTRDELEFLTSPDERGQRVPPPVPVS